MNVTAVAAPRFFATETTASRLTSRDVALGAAAGITLAVCLSTTGYFAPAWGWAALLSLWAAALALLVRPTTPPGLVWGGLLALGTLAAFAALRGAAYPQMSEAQRTLAYIAALLLVVAWGRRAAHVVAGVVFAMIAVAGGYGTATRLIPDRIGIFDPVAEYRLAEPLGYWNALGIICAVALVLGLAFIARERALLRALTGAAVPLLALTLYFTFSRGAWIALGIGLAAALALDSRRMRLATSALAIAPFAVVVTWLASHSEPLTRQNASLEDAARDGHRLALWLGLCCAGAAAAAALPGVAERRVTIPRAVSRAWAGVLVLALVVGLGVTFARFGDPVTIGRNAVEAFKAPPPRVEDDLSARLWSFSGNGRAELWEAAWNQFRESPILGSGAGTFEQYWLQHREIPLKVRDAHSLYLETLAELGIIGLMLLLVALLVPVYAAFKARRHPLVPAAFGAYVAYLVHAGVDWDWEMPAVTLTALFIGASIVVVARPTGVDEKPMGPRLRYGLLAGTLALACVAFVGLGGNLALSQSASAARTADWSASAEQARTARTWAPWSPDPWTRLGEAEMAQGDLAAAQEAFRTATEKAPGDWSRWLDLARATSGAEQRRALAEASRLNPLSPEIARFRAEITGQTVTAVEEIGK